MEALFSISHLTEEGEDDREDQIILMGMEYKIMKLKQSKKCYYNVININIKIMVINYYKYIRLVLIKISPYKL